MILVQTNQFGYIFVGIFPRYKRGWLYTVNRSHYVFIFPGSWWTFFGGYITIFNYVIFKSLTSFRLFLKWKKNKKKLRINSLDGVMFKVVKLFFFGFIHNFLVLNKKYKFWRTTVDQGLLYNFVQFRELYCLCLFLNNFFFFGFSGGCIHVVSVPNGVPRKYDLLF